MVPEDSTWEVDTLGPPRQDPRGGSQHAGNMQPHSELVPGWVSRSKPLSLPGDTPASSGTETLQ